MSSHKSCFDFGPVGRILDTTPEPAIAKPKLVSLHSSPCALELPVRGLLRYGVKREAKSAEHRFPNQEAILQTRFGQAAGARRLQRAKAVLRLLIAALTNLPQRADAAQVSQYPQDTFRAEKLPVIFHSCP